MQLIAAYLATLSVFIALNLTWNGLVVEVMDMDGRRIDKLLVRRA